VMTSMAFVMRVPPSCPAQDALAGAILRVAARTRSSLRWHGLGVQVAAEPVTAPAEHEVAVAFLQAKRLGAPRHGEPAPAPYDDLASDVQPACERECPPATRMQG
jgi:hypothetical protein